MKILKTKDVKTPNRATAGSSGLDFFVPNNFETLHLLPGKSITIDSGIKAVIPDGYVGIFYNKSSIASKGLLVGACVVDQDYLGVIYINLWNISDTPIQINPGQKIVQMVLSKVPYIPVCEITEEEFNEYTTERGSGSFGSTGAY